MSDPEEGLDLYYQATKTDTVFHAIPQDSEGVPLADYRTAEKAEVLRFLKDPSLQVSVIGGISSTTKSFVLEQIAKAENLHFMDLMAISGEAGESNPKALADLISKEAKEDIRGSNTDTPKGLIIDESTLLFTHDKIRPSTQEVIYELIKRYGKNHFTGRRQSIHRA